MTVYLDGYELPEQPVVVRWQIRPIGKTGGGDSVFSKRMQAQMVFTLAPMASGSISALMSAWDNEPHTFVLPHPVTQNDTVYSGTYIKNIDFSVANKSDNSRASVIVLLNVRFDVDLFIVPIRDIACLEGTVSADPTEPYMNIAYSSGATGTSSIYGTSGAPMAGNTVEFIQPSGAVLGRVRLRSWNGGIPSGAINVAENDDITPLVKAGDTVRVYQRFDLHAIAPRPVKSGGTVTWYEDYDISYTDQTDNYPPVAVAGIPAVGFLDGGSVALNFYGEKSFAVKDGAGISSWLWTAHGSVEGTSTSEGTYLSPVVFTFTQSGQHLVSLKVTDTNGKTHTSYTWAVVIDPGAPEPPAYTAIGEYSDSQDYNNGGGSANVRVFGVVDRSVFADNGMVIVAARGDITGGTHPALDRDNILFVGYIKNGTLSYSYDKSEVSFSLQTIDGVLRKTKTFPVSLKNVASPSTWLEARRLMVDKAAVHFLRWRTTLLNMNPFQGMGYTAFIYRQDFNGGDAYSEIDRLYQDAWGHLASDSRGWLVGERDYQLMTTGSERVLTETGVSLDKNDWLNALSISEVRSFARQTSKMDMEGVAYNGVDEPSALFSTAPGEVPKEFGSPSKKGNLILTTQNDLNIRCGLGLAKENIKYPQINAVFLNDVRFFVSPQRRFLLRIEPEDNSLGLDWDAVVIPRKVSRRYNPDGGFFLTQVQFEPDASGAPGITVTMPNDAPTPGGGTETLSSGTVSLVAAGSLWRSDDNYAWTDAGVSAEVFSLIVDPYSNVGGVTPNLWYGGSGILRWTEDPTAFYTDVTPTGTPLNVWGDTSVPSFNNVIFAHLAADVRTQGVLFAAAQWNESVNGNYRFEILRSENGGLSWESGGMWWMASGLSRNDVYGAYQAIGAFSYDNSLLNRNDAGMHDLTTGIAPSWDADTGWEFTGTEYLISGFKPTEEMTVIVSVSDLTTAPDTILGEDEAGSDFSITFSYGSTITTFMLAHYPVSSIPFGFVHGVATDKHVLAVATDTAGKYGYLDGIGGLQSTSSGFTNSTYSLFIGALNSSGSASDKLHGKIRCIAIYNKRLTASQIHEITSNIQKMRQ